MASGSSIRLAIAARMVYRIAAASSGRLRGRRIVDGSMSSKASGSARGATSFLGESMIDATILRVSSDGTKVETVARLGRRRNRNRRDDS